jgi:hypothetical protein
MAYRGSRNFVIGTIRDDRAVTSGVNNSHVRSVPCLCTLNIWVKDQGGQMTHRRSHDFAIDPIRDDRAVGATGISSVEVREKRYYIPGINESVS